MQMCFTGLKEIPVNCWAGIENAWKSELIQNVKIVLNKSNNLMRLPSCFICISGGHTLVLYSWKADSIEKGYTAKKQQEDVSLSKWRIRSAAEFDKPPLLLTCGTSSLYSSRPTWSKGFRIFLILVSISPFPEAFIMWPVYTSHGH